MQIEAYKPADYEAVISLYKNRRAYGGTFDEQRDEAERLMATALAGDLFVARFDAEIVGTIMFLANPHSFWLLRFAVDPDHPQSQRVRDELTLWATDIARARGHSSIIAYTDSMDEQLNEQYVKAGYNKAGNYRCYWKEVG